MFSDLCFWIYTQQTIELTPPHVFYSLGDLFWKKDKIVLSSLLDKSFDDSNTFWDIKSGVRCEGISKGESNLHLIVLH